MRSVSRSSSFGLDREQMFFDQRESGPSNKNVAASDSVQENVALAHLQLSLNMHRLRRLAENTGILQRHSEN